jgi:hypothetical protein
MTIMQPSFQASRIRFTSSLQSLNSTSTRIIQNQNEITLTLVYNKIVAPDELIPTSMNMSSVKPSEDVLQFLANQLLMAKNVPNKVEVEYSEDRDEESEAWSYSSLNSISN